MVGFSWLGAAGGAAEAVTAGWAEDRRAQALKKASMLQIVMPEAMRLRNKRRDKKDRFKVMFRKLRNYLPNNSDLAFGLLESGEEYANDWMKRVEKYRAELPKNTDLSDLNRLKAAGMVSNTYTPPDKVPDFDTWWNDTMVGKPGEHANPKQERSLKSAMQKQFGIMSDASIRDQVYGDVATAVGGDYANVWSDMAGTRIKTPSGFTAAIRLPESELDREAFNFKLADMKLKNRVIGSTVMYEGEKIPIGLASSIEQFKKLASETELNNAKAFHYNNYKGQTGAYAKSLDKFTNKYMQVRRNFNEMVASNLGYTYHEVEPGNWKYSPEGAEPDKKRMDVILQATSMMANSWAQDASKLYSEGKEPVYNSLVKITESHSTPADIQNYIAMAAAALDVNSKLNNKGTGEDYFKSVAGFLSNNKVLKDNYDKYKKQYRKETPEQVQSAPVSEAPAGAQPTRVVVGQAKEETEEKRRDYIDSVKDTLQSVIDVPDAAANTTAALREVSSYIEFAIEHKMLNIPGMEDASVETILESKEVGNLIGGEGMSLRELLINNPKLLMEIMVRMNAGDFSNLSEAGSADTKSTTPIISDQSNQPFRTKGKSFAVRRE